MTTDRALARRTNSGIGHGQRPQSARSGSFGGSVKPFKNCEVVKRYRPPKSHCWGVVGKPQQFLSDEAWFRGCLRRKGRLLPGNLIPPILVPFTHAPPKQS